MNRIKLWLKDKWNRFKAWGYGLLVLLGLAAAPTLIAVEQTFTYDPPTTYTDGTPLPPEQIGSTRLYCSGSQVAEEPGSDGNIQADLPPGTHDCYATVIGTNGVESPPSNIVQRVVLPDVAPNPPVLDP